MNRETVVYNNFAEEIHSIDDVIFVRSSYGVVFSYRRAPVKSLADTAQTIQADTTSPNDKKSPYSPDNKIVKTLSGAKVIHPKLSFEKSCSLLESHLRSVQERLQTVIEECQRHMTELVGMASTNAGQNAILGTYKQCGTHVPGRPVVYNKLNIKSNRLCSNLYNVEQKMRIVEQMLNPSENKVTALLCAQMEALRISKECGQRAKLCSEMNKAVTCNLPRIAGPVIYQPDVIRLHALRSLMPEVPHRQRISLNTKTRASDARFEDWDIVDCKRGLPENADLKINRNQRLAALLSMGTQTDLQTRSGEDTTPFVLVEKGHLVDIASFERSIENKLPGADVIQSDRLATRTIQETASSSESSTPLLSDLFVDKLAPRTSLVSREDKTTSSSDMTVSSLKLPSFTTAYKAFDLKSSSEQPKQIISSQSPNVLSFAFGQNVATTETSNLLKLSAFNISTSSNESLQSSTPIAKSDILKFQPSTPENISKCPQHTDSEHSKGEKTGTFLFGKISSTDSPSNQTTSSLFSSGLFNTSSFGLTIDQAESQQLNSQSKTESNWFKLDNATTTFALSKSIEAASPHFSDTSQLDLGISALITTTPKTEGGEAVPVITSTPLIPSGESPSASVNFVPASITVEPLPQRTRSSLGKATLQNENQLQKQNSTTCDLTNVSLSLVTRSNELIISDTKTVDTVSTPVTTQAFKGADSQMNTLLPSLQSCLSINYDAFSTPSSTTMQVPCSVNETLMFSNVQWSAKSDNAVCPPIFSFGKPVSAAQTSTPPPTFTFGVPSKPSDVTTQSPFTKALLSNVSWPSSTKPDITSTISQDITKCSLNLSTPNALGASQITSPNASPLQITSVFGNFTLSTNSNVSNTSKEEKTSQPDIKQPSLFGACSSSLFSPTTSNSGVLDTSLFRKDAGLSSVTNTGIFGAVQSTPLQASLFGNSPFAQTQPSTVVSAAMSTPSALFGAFKSPFASSFGSNTGLTTTTATLTTPSIFGSGSSSGIFGSTQSNLFNSSMFSSNTTKSDDVPVLKFANQNSFFGNHQSSSLFGNTNSNGVLFPTASPFAISSTTSEAQMKPLFATTTPTVSGLFGTTVKSDPFSSGKSSLFGSTFGAQTQQPQASTQALFGSTTTASAFFSSGSKTLFGNIATTSSSGISPLFDGSKPVALFGKPDTNVEAAREQVRSKYSGASFTSFRD